MNKRRGFTIVELLVVIVVIAILAAITIVAYNGVQDRAKTQQVATGLKQTEKSLRLYLIAIDANTWPQDNVIDPVHVNPTITELIADTAYKLYMQTSPEAADTTLTWNYDNDGDVKPTTGLNYNGTNIIIAGISDKLATNIDVSMDDGVANTGRVRRDSVNSKLLYTLSFDSSL